MKKSPANSDGPNSLPPDSLNSTNASTSDNGIEFTSLGSNASSNGFDTAGRQTPPKPPPPSSAAGLKLAAAADRIGSSSDDAAATTSDSSTACSSPAPPASLQDLYTTPTNFKSRSFFYPENDGCADLESQIVEFLHALFWILESKRLERSREKVDRVPLLQAPFEKKDMVGLDMDSRNNRKRCMGRITKNLADLTLQAGLVADSLTLFHAAAETLRGVNDSLWLAAAGEGLCAASAILLHPMCRQSEMAGELQRNKSLPVAGGSAEKSQQQQTLPSAKQSLGLGNQLTVQKSTAAASQAVDVDVDGAAAVAIQSVASTSSSTSSVSSMLLASSASSSSTSVSPLSTTVSTSTLTSASTNSADSTPSTATPSNVLAADDIAVRYRDAIINYSKYRHAGIIETEAALKAARICIAQGKNLDVAMFLQNVLYINLNMNEQERVHRFETLTLLYQRIGYHRKAAFCQRLAAWRHVAQSNTTPDWSQSYRLMLDSFGGHRLSLDPLEVLRADAGWPCLQVDLVQQLVFAAKRLGQSALATRHQTFLLQTMWRHLGAGERKELALQLQSLSAQCEGAPVPLVLESGMVIPPANLTDLPMCEQFAVRELAGQLRPLRRVEARVESSPFLFTPIHFQGGSAGAVVDRRGRKDESKIGEYMDGCMNHMTYS